MACPPRISPKETGGANGKFLPRPLFLRLRNPKLAEVWRILLIVFALPSFSFGEALCEAQRRVAQY